MSKSKPTSRTGAKPPSFLAVAQKAKVSPATVTRVLSGAGGVSKPLQERVLRAAEALGVGPRKNRSRMVAFFLSNRDVLHPFQARILLGAEAYCASQGWEMLFLSVRYSLGAAPNEIHLPEIAGRRDLLRGVILGGTNSAGLLAALEKKGIPFAVSGNNVVGEWQTKAYDVVSSDDVAGSYELTAGLIAQGHRSIWYIGDLQFSWYAHCAEGYRRAMREAGLEPRIKEVHTADRELGYLGAKSILSGHSATAIFAGNDQVAVGVYRAFGEAGVSIPGDISVVGFNDTAGENLYPRLTSVREFPEELGKHLAELVLQRIESPGLAPRQILLPTQVMRRDSCARPEGPGGGFNPPKRAGRGEDRAERQSSLQTVSGDDV
jgi:DNA-binding LacI/PurR family transcriptional regulator